MDNKTIQINDKTGMKEELKESSTYISLIERLKSIYGECNLFEKTPEAQAKFVVATLYDLTRDENLCLAGLIYLLSSNHDIQLTDNARNSIGSTIHKWLNDLTKISQIIDNFSLKEKIINNIQEILTKENKSLLDDSYLDKILSMDENTGVNEIIIMIFLIMCNGQDIRALIIEMVCRLSLLMGIKKCDNQDIKQNKLKYWICQFWHHQYINEPLTNINNKPINKKLTFKLYFAFETFKIFVPIANRLGLWSLKWQLEDLCFKQIEPDIYSEIKSLLNQKREQREEYMKYCVVFLEKTLEKAIKQDKFSISGRTKSIYSTYAKMKQLYSYKHNDLNSKVSYQRFARFLKEEINTSEDSKNNNQFKELFEGVHDLFGVRVICDSVDTCYTILGIINENLKRESTFLRKYGELADYIAAPKPNGYQSIHLVVHAPLPPKESKLNIQDDGKLEVQIRTEQMHKEAEYGVAAHWKYKELGYSQGTTGEDYVFTALKEFTDQNGVSATQEFIKSFDTYLPESNIYVFTPRGKVIALEKESTPVDFAYRIHTNVGNHCSGARVNGKIIPLSKKLKNGDIVEIIKHNKGQPSLDWLMFVRPYTAKKIEQWHKDSHRKENILLGRELLIKELDKTKFTDKKNKNIDNLLRSEFMQEIVKKLNYISVDDLFAEIGYSNLSVSKVANLFNDKFKEQTKERGWEILKKLLITNKLAVPQDLELEIILEKVAQHSDYRTSDNLLLSLGNTAREIDLNKIVQDWREVVQDKNINDEVLINKSKNSNQNSEQNNPIKGIEGLTYHIAGCCQPLPEELIIGIVTRGDGISIHHQKCRNVRPYLLALNNRGLIDVSWNFKNEHSIYSVDIQIQTNNRIGIIRDITSYLADQNININELQVKTFKVDDIALVNLSIDVNNLRQLENCMASIQKIKNVMQVRRVSETNIDFD
jgi:(p)ppGpp synthase/HD superfamily hydrolase